MNFYISKTSRAFGISIKNFIHRKFGLKRVGPNLIATVISGRSRLKLNRISATLDAWYIYTIHIQSSPIFLYDRFLNKNILILCQVELAECREKAALGWGRYKHNQQLEELRNLQEQLQEERRLWQDTKQEQQSDLQHKKETMAKLQVGHSYFGFIFLLTNQGKMLCSGSGFRGLKKRFRMLKSLQNYLIF